MTEICKCRSCFSDIFESNSLSINLVGYETITFKEMFETSIGYEILPTEPQYFCDLCVQKLMEWYNYRAMCKDTQDKLIEVPIKNEIETSNHSDLLWCDEIITEPEIKSEPEATENNLILSEIMQQDESSQLNLLSDALQLELFEVEFTVLLQNFPYQSQKSMLSLGRLNVVGQSLSDVSNQIWLFVQPHLKREIIFVDETPEWHPDEEQPQEHQLMQFITINDVVGKRRHENLSTVNFRKLQRKEVFLYVHPYSKNIKSKIHWTKAQTLISDPERTPTDRQENETFVTLIIEFEMLIRTHLSSKLENAQHLGVLEVQGNTLAEIMSQIWQFVKKHLIHEIIFDENGENPIWHPLDIPKETDLLRFIVFKDDISKKYYSSPSFYNFKSWTERRPAIHIFPYSKNIATTSHWNTCKRVIFGGNPLPVPPLPSTEETEVLRNTVIKYEDSDSETNSEISNHETNAFLCEPSSSEFNNDGNNFGDNTNFNHRKFSCLKCGKKFASKYTCHKHLKTHKGNFECYICGRIFKTERGSKLHMALHVNNMEI